MTGAPPQRYQAVSPKERPRRPNRVAQAAAQAKAAFAGAPLLFPRRFDRAVAALIAGKPGPTVTPEAAQAYFGAPLAFDVDPAVLTERLSDFVRDEGGRTRWIGASFLDRAEWRRALKRVDRSPVHREVAELIAAGLDWRETRGYGVFLRAIGEGEPLRRNGIPLDTREAVEAYFRYCADLIDSMRAHGIVARRAVGRLDRSWLDRHRSIRPAALNYAERDVGVAVAADGRLVRHLGGKHRTAVAQALALPSMPVEVRLVHAGWLAREMQRSGLPAHRALPEALARLAAEKRA